MKAKRLFALLLSFVMVISMLPGTALAANEPAVELKIAEETLADKAGLSVELVVDSGANNASTISTIYAYDMALLELVDSTGAALAVTEEVKISPKAAIARYEDADLGSDTWSLKNVYVATAGNDVGLVHAAFIANPELCEAYYSNKGIPMDNAAVVKMFFALKDGASAYEAAESIRLATAAEAEKMGQNEAAMFVDGVDNAFILNSLDVDDTAGFELPVSHSIEAPHVHAWGEPAVTEPTCTEKGKKVYTCACGETKTEETAALGHTFAEGTCSVCGAADPDYVAPQPPVEEPVVETVEAVYIGVKDFLTLDTDNVKEDDFIHLFFVDGETVEADVEGGDPYVIENQLRGGYIYNVTFTDGVVTAVEEAEVATGVAGDFDLAGKALYEIESPIQPEGAVVNVVDTIADDATVKVTANAAYKAFVAEPYEAPVTATPGEKTLKNFLATALAPVGTALYVYGGGWDWQDGSGYASSNQSMTIGLPQEWIDFFQANDETYHFKQTDASGSHANSVYTSNRGWNQYYWAGIDCSGYVGWVTWNTLHTENGVKGVDEGYVGSSTSQAKNMAQKGWGTLDQGDVNADGKHTYANATFNVGDVFSMNGHVWICLGTCEDGSILFAHSTPNTSNGAGAQLSAIGESKDCQAYQLASYYMETYYPQWGERYDALLMSFTGYTNTTGSNAGKFTWDLENGILTDEEGFAAMTPVEIMGELYGDDFVPSEEEEPEQPEQPVVLDGEFEAVYVGVKDFLTLDTDNVKEDDFIHLFFVDGETVEADVEGGDPYVIENQLRGGYIYNVTFTDGVVTAVEEAEVATGVAGDFDLAGKALYEIESPIQPEGAVVNVVDTIADDATVKVTANAAYKAFVAEPYEAPVTATPGEKTLKNFLATALAPVGTALYVYGGGWDWQDGSGYASSNQSMTIGLPQEWIDFFQANDETYHFKQTDASGSHANSVYTSNRGWNQYYWAGIDCSGYVGWVTWNTLHTENGVKGVDEGYVGSSTSQAKNMAQKGWGTLDQGDVNADGKHTYANATFNVGDVFSMNGHVWICLGTCEDGSILFAHSTPNTSNGAGAQLSAIGESKDCQAYQLASYYMETYYPQWGERYDALLMSFTGYTNTTGSNAGKFTWDLENGILTDEEGFAAMTPVEIMGELYGDDFVPGEEEEPEQPEQPEEPVVLDGKFEAVYIGVKDFLTLDTDEVAEDDFIHLFFVGGETVEADVAGGDPYVIENKLMGGYIYDVTFEDGVVVDAELAKVETGVAADFDLSDKPFYEIESPLQPTGAVVYEIEGLFDEDTVKVTKNAVYKTFVAEEYTAPVAGKPGKTTLKNFLTTALMPVGTALYVYGGCWDWQDDASSNQSITIGIPQEWVDFFQANDTTYHYKQKDASGSHANSVYTSNRGWNQYYWAGVDCSAYVAWTTWNTLNAKDGEFGKDGYVMSSTNMAYNFADYGWGTYDEGARVLNEDGTIYKDGDGDTYRLFDVADFKVGDIFSDNGHVWICLGVCEDGSMVFMHSTPSTSKDGLGEGGGIQISALDLQDRETCEAAELADYYMTTYYPQWAERYDAVTKGESYIKVYDTGMPGTDGYRFRKAGRFSWDLEDGILSDPDDYSKLTPAEILADIFAEEEEKDEPSAPSKPSTPSKPSKPEVEEPETPAEPEQPEQPEVPAEKPVFEDVPADHWAADAIEKVVEKGLFKGVEADKFAPSADITREQIMTVLARAAGADTEGDALAKGMAWAKENGISDGTNGKGKVTREQLVTMLYRVAVKNGMDVTVSGAALDFADAASISAFAQEAMQWAIENGIINGMSETTLAPQGPATRAQIAIIMVRFENL